MGAAGGLWIKLSKRNPLSQRVSTQRISQVGCTANLGTHRIHVRGETLWEWGRLSHVNPLKTQWEWGRLSHDWPWIQ